MSFQQGLSGLNTSSKHLDTIGNNVANSGTVGFKMSQAQFADLFAVSLSGGGGTQAGTGVKVAAIVQQFTQGNITNTNNPMDTAISGQGFFRMVDQNGAILYSRNGQFQTDKNGFIVNNQGHQVTGYMPNPTTGLINTASPVPLQINAADLVPKQTSNLANGGVPITAGLNLDSRSAFPIGLTQASVSGGVTASALTIAAGANDGLSVTVDGTVSGAITIPAGTYTASTLAAAVQSAINADATLALASKSVTVAASATGVLTITSNSTGPASSLVVDPLSSADTTLFPGGQTAVAGAGVFNPLDATTYNNSTSLTIYDSLGSSHVASLYFQKVSPNTWNSYLTVDSVQVPVAGTALTQLQFDTLGQLTAPAAVAPLALGQVTSSVFNPAGASPMDLTFDFSASSQYGGSFGVNKMTQDGYTSGRLNGFSTSSDGTILGRYSNGQSRAMGQMLLANFTNPQGLQPMGNNEWVETSGSGGPLIGLPGSASLGLLQSSATEDSNVDLNAELVNMITAQRVYQANAQTIKAQDQVLQTLVNLR
ncbi:MAG: flagellar hook-basal body complex protein [Gallionella sp.]|nr:flagellar hook-basal body complex protein [Gallionella sp.]